MKSITKFLLAVSFAFLLFFKASAQDIRLEGPSIVGTPGLYKQLIMQAGPPIGTGGLPSFQFLPLTVPGGGTSIWPIHFKMATYGNGGRTYPFVIFDGGIKIGRPDLNYHDWDFIPQESPAPGYNSTLTGTNPTMGTSGHSKSLLHFKKIGNSVRSNTIDIKCDGTGFFNNLVATTTSFPDYVFYPEYDLMPLEKVEAHIKKHHRLPNMPSEEEVIQNGLDLGKINLLLVEKVEELTLHLIESQKALRSLEKQFEEFKQAQQ